MPASASNTNNENVCVKRWKTASWIRNLLAIDFLTATSELLKRDSAESVGMVRGRVMDFSDIWSAQTTSIREKRNCHLYLAQIQMARLIKQKGLFVDYFSICAQTRSRICLVNESGKGTYSSSNAIFFPFLNDQSKNFSTSADWALSAGVLYIRMKDAVVTG